MEAVKLSIEKLFAGDKRILLEPVELEEVKTKGGIVLVNNIGTLNSCVKIIYGKVVAVNENVKNIKKDYIVAFAEASAPVVLITGKTLHVLLEDGVLYYQKG